MVTSTSAGPIAAGTEQDKRAERRFFASYTIVIALIIVAGFAPSFFLRGLMPPYVPLRPLPPELIAHGLLAATFTLFFPLQAWLIASGKRAVHVKLGNWGFALGAAMLPASYMVAAFTYNRVLPADPNFAAIVAGVALSALPTLIVLLALGWRRRFDAQTHKRLMVVIICVLADPAIARLPLWGAPPLGFVVGQLAMLALLIPLWVWDFARRGRPHWATVLGTLLYVFELTWRLPVITTPQWRAFVAGLPGFG